MLRNQFYKVADFHHFGLAVKEFERPIRFYNTIGYNCSAPIRDDLRGVELVMCTSEHLPNIELIRPIDDQSPIKNYLKNSNEVIYHTCFEVESVEKTLEIIKNKSRVILVSKPTPAVLFDNRCVSFYYIQNVGLFEFLVK